MIDYVDRFNPESPVPGAEIVRRASTVALNVTLIGGPRDRLFIF